MDDDALVQTLGQRLRETRQKLKAAEDQVGTAGNALETLRGRLKVAEEEAQCLKEYVEDGKQEVEQMKIDANTAADEISDLESELQTTKDETRLAEEREALCRSEVKELERMVDALRAEVTAEAELTGVAQREIEDGKGEISRLESQVKTIKNSLQAARDAESSSKKKAAEEARVTEILREELETAKKDADDAYKKVQAKGDAIAALSQEVVDAKKEAEVAKGKLGIASSFAGLKTKQVDTAVVPAETKQQATILEQTVNCTRNAADGEAKTPQQALLDEALTTIDRVLQDNDTDEQTDAKHSFESELQQKNEEITSLQERLRQEKRAYEALQRTVREQTLKSRSVSADLLCSYLSKPGVVLKSELTETIKLREHKWVLSEIADLPNKLNWPIEADEYLDEAGDDGAASLPHVVPNNSALHEQNHTPRATSSTEDRAMGATQDPRSIKYGSGEPVWSELYIPEVQLRTSRSGVRWWEATPGEQSRSSIQAASIFKRRSGQSFEIFAKMVKLFLVGFSGI